MVHGLSELRTSADLFLQNTVTMLHTVICLLSRMLNVLIILVSIHELQIDQLGKEAHMVIKTNRHGSVEQSRVMSATDNDWIKKFQLPNRFLQET